MYISLKNIKIFCYATTTVQLAVTLGDGVLIFEEKSHDDIQVMPLTIYSFGRQAVFVYPASATWFQQQASLNRSNFSPCKPT